MATIPPGPVPAFNPALWLGALTTVGGGYALMTGRRLAFLVVDVDGDALTSVMSQIVGHPDRQEAIKAAIERRRNGEA